MPRTTHETSVEFTLDPGFPGATFTIYAGAEKTAEGTTPYFNRVTGDADPGGPEEYEIHTVQFWDSRTGTWQTLAKETWETFFGESWNDLLEFLEGELEAA